VKTGEDAEWYCVKIAVGFPFLRFLFTVYWARGEERTMTRNILVDVRKAERESAPPMVLYYYLMQRDALEGSPEAGAVYGIGIVKRVDGEKKEQEWIPGISCSRMEVQDLLGRMAACTVTPVGAAAVVDDYIGGR